MAAPQLSVRITPSLNERLKNYTARTGISKTDVINYALAQYLGSIQEISLAQRVARIEAKIAILEIPKGIKNY